MRGVNVALTRRRSARCSGGSIWVSMPRRTGAAAGTSRACRTRTWPGRAGSPRRRRGGTRATCRSGRARRGARRASWPARRAGRARRGRWVAGRRWWQSWSPPTDATPGSGRGRSLPTAAVASVWAARTGRRTRPCRMSRTARSPTGPRRRRLYGHALWPTRRPASSRSAPRRTHTWSSTAVTASTRGARRRRSGLAAAGARWAGSTWSSGSGRSCGRRSAPATRPEGVHGFDDPWSGRTGSPCPPPSTTWCCGSPGRADLVFDAVTRRERRAARTWPSSPRRRSGWSYHRDRDLTGFVDGTENPTLVEAPALVYVPDGAGRAVGLLLQKWEHEASAWMALDTAAQEQAIGRPSPTASSSTDKPATSHAARTDQDTYGHIFRRNTPYGTRESSTARCSSASARSSARSRRCSKAWPGWTDPATSSRRYTRPLTGRVLRGPGRRRADGAMTDIHTGPGAHRHAAGHTGEIRRLAWAPDGLRVATPPLRTTRSGSGTSRQATTAA